MKEGDIYMNRRYYSRSELMNKQEERQKKDNRLCNMIQNLCTDIIVMCIISLLLFAMTGCKTKAQIEYRDSIHVEYKEILVPDTVTIEIPAEEKERETNDSTSFLETSMAESMAKLTWKDGTPWLFHSLKNKPQKIRKVIYTKLKIKTVYRTRYVTRTQYIEKDLSWWQKALIGAGWLLFITVGGAVLVFFVRMKFF